MASCPIKPSWFFNHRPVRGRQRPKPFDILLMQPFPLPMNSILERRRWEQQLTNDPVEANMNTVLIAMTGGGVGHHWVPINVLLTLFEEGLVSLEEVFDFAALTSGALRGGHDYTMVYGGITHSQYAIAQYWRTPVFDLYG